MQHPKPTAGVVIALVLLGGLLAFPLLGREQHILGRDAAPRQGWEYASLSIDARAGGVRWVTPTESVKAGQFPKLCETIGLDLDKAYKLLGVRRLPMAEVFGQSTAPQFDRADHTVFCNHVGKDGWELVQHYSAAYTAPHGPADVWVFKRPRR